MRTQRSFEGQVALAALTLLGCSDASGTLRGGESIFDGGQPTISEASTSDDGASTLPSICQAGGTNGGSRWQDLYACYFGPSGTSKCGTAGCHATGGVIWSCGDTADSCRTGMIAANLVPTTSGTDATQSTLYSALRKVNAASSGLNDNMPLSPQSVVYTTADLTRISTWIQGGAPNN